MNVDGLAAMMFVVVTTVSLLRADLLGRLHARTTPRFTWYFAALSLFTGSMLNLVIANNLFQMLVGWELVGICSYLLIGHFWEEKENSRRRHQGVHHHPDRRRPVRVRHLRADRRRRAPRTSPHITELAEHGELSPRRAAGRGDPALFGGAIGKSAQFPLHVWLPDAMAGPTPVSALIHAATMVAAGVYLVGRMFPVFVASDGGRAGVRRRSSRGITMLIAALLAMVQDDIKRVLAYSTISQLALHDRRALAGSGPATRRRCSTCSPTRSSRPCCSWARAR